MTPIIIYPFFVSLLLLLLPSLYFTNDTYFPDTIGPGQSLNTTETIVSDNGWYGLGFFSPENSTKHYLVIYEYKNWGKSYEYDDIVWVANREHPFPNSSAILTFNSDGNLVISGGGLKYALSNTSSGGNDTYATLLDTGNLVLMNWTSDILWQSFFDYPTDTILPGMKLKDAKTGWSLTSWKSEEDPAPGLFSLQYLASRKQLILMKGSEPYWSSPLIDQLADIFVIHGDYFTWRSSDYGSNEIRRIRLDISGNLLLQTWKTYSNYWYSFCLHNNNKIDCNTTDTIRPGQSLNTSKSIVSANGMYELGFFSPDYYVGIRYYNVSGANVVWVANRDTFLNSSAALTLDSDGNLLISDGILTNISGGNDTYARLLNTGNLILTNRDSHILWQSIDYPTDTLLPGMKLKDAQTGWSLKSWISDGYPGSGRFSLQYLASRKQLILMEGSEAYWISSLSGVLADIFLIDGEYITWPSNYTNDITSIRLDIPGNLIMESGIYGSKSDDLTKCGTYSVCGDFTMCNETVDAVFICDCLPGFRAYPMKGCVRNTNLSCSDGVQKDGFLRISNVFLPSGPQYDFGRDVGNISVCESFCLNQCSCTGYTYDHRCLTWEGPLLNLTQFSEDNTYTKDFYLKLARADLAPKGISVIGDYYCFSGVFFL